MYLRIDENGYQFTEEQPENRAYIGIFTYDMMQEQAKLRNISYHVLEEARRFGFARYDSLENYDCISLEMQDFHNVLISHGSVVIYLEKNQALFFTSKPQHVRHVLRDCSRRAGRTEFLSSGSFTFSWKPRQRKKKWLLIKSEKEILELEQRSSHLRRKISYLKLSICGNGSCS